MGGIFTFNEWIVDWVAGAVGYWRPGFLTRDTLKMCWRAQPLMSGRGLLAPDHITVIPSGAAPADWLETISASGMPVTAATWEREFGAGRKEARVFGVYADGRLAGAAGIRAVEGFPSYAYLLWVGVHPAYRGRHFGRALVEHAMQHAVLEGFEFVMLLTDDHRIPAITLYLALGFTPCLLSWDRTQRLRWRRVLRQIPSQLPSQVACCRETSHRGPVSALPL